MKSQIRTTLFTLLAVAALSSAAQVPTLNSYPSASATLFLDFDGHTVDGAMWTGSFDPLFCAGSGLTGTQMTEIFNRVAEDYRPFEINVTTDSTQFLAAPLNRRMRVIVTTTHGWYPGAGGVAYIGAFSWGDDTPCFVFSAALGYNTKRIAEAAAHEAGHTLGLYHQAVYDANCSLVSSYNSGTGSGEIGWAPIMGVGYYRNFTLWNYGPNPYGCDQSQSDLDVITSLNGFGYRDDDHSSNSNSATIVVFSNNQFNVSGIIERNTDQDLVKFILPVAGQFQLNAVPYSVGAGNAGSDLDMQVTLYNGSKKALNVYNPGSTLNLVVDTSLEAGTYYARIEGKGNEYAPAYASLGSYSLQASFNDGSTESLPLKKLELKGVVDGNKHLLNWIVVADENIVHQTIEISTDGKNFNTLTETTADARSYAYVPSVNGAALYRINVSFDNGRQYLSNTISLRQSAGGVYRPVLNGNIISSSFINITSPSSYSYQITDLNGRSISKGVVNSGANSIAIPGIASAMYFINFTNGKEQWTEKFIKQ